MKISVVILTLNAEKYISRQLKFLQKQTIIPQEIIIIDSSSQDNTCEIVKSYGIEPIIIEQKNFSHAGTRNYAMSLARGEIVLFLSQDALPMDCFLIENLVRVLQVNEKIGASYGRHIPYPNAKLTEIIARSINYPEEACVKDISLIPMLGLKTFFFSNSCSAIKKKVWQEIGGFREDIIIAEDIIFAACILKKGYKIAYVPEAKVMHSHNFSFKQYYKRYYEIGKTFARYKWIINDMHKLNKQGNEIVIKQIKYLIKKKQFVSIFYMCLENFFKYMGFKMGFYLSKRILK